MKIAILGGGYVGLATTACLARLGHHVTCVEVDPARLSALCAGRLPIHEPGLDDLVAEGRAAGRIAFSGVPERAVQGVEVAMLAVGTPPGPQGDIDLSQVCAAAQVIAPHLPVGAVVAIKSTVVPGTAREVAALIARTRGSADIPVASTPEFLREGTAIDDFLNADRVVIGTSDPRAERVLRRLHAPLVRTGTRLMVMGPEDAELAKYASNALLALRIGFVNELSDLCAAVGGEIEGVTAALGADRRIGPAFLSPGPGFGGSCFPKDIAALAAAGRRHGTPQTLIEALAAQNAARPAALADRIRATLRPGARIAVLGLAFKAGTDDCRAAAACTIVPALQAAGFDLALHDPCARPDLPGRQAATVAEAAEGADALVILTEWAEYGALDIPALARAMRGRTIFDFRNLLDPAAAAAAGFTLHSLGRPVVLPVPARRVAAS